MKSQEKEFRNELRRRSNDPSIKWHYECDHLTKGVSADIALSDYHPFDHKGQIEELLTIAEMSERWQTKNSIQIRVQQGVPGVLDPHEIDTPPSIASEKIGQMIIENNSSPLIAPEIWAIIQSMKEQG